MVSNDKRKFERLCCFLKKLQVRGNRGIPLLVEGKKDFVAIRKLGVKGKVVCVKNSPKLLFDLLDDIQSEEVTLFVDFDESGVSLTKRITKYLEGKRVKANIAIWKEVLSLIRNDVKDIEGVPSYFEKLKKRVSYS